MAYISFKPTDYFTSHLYSGNDSTNNQTSLGMTPDLVWVKSRNTGSPTQHYWVDKVRGDKKYISSNSTAAEATDSNTFDLVSGGFNLAGGNGWTNVSGRTYVAWNWKAGGAGSSNSDGSITSTVSASTTSGFSICKWSGSGANATIGHGLGAVPKMIITKSMASSSWCVYHASLGNTKTLFLESSGSGNTHVAYYNNTSPTSSVFTVGSDDAVNHSGNNMIAYCFSEKKGFSKFGSYTGNGNQDGAFIYTGFKPAFVIVKRVDGTASWVMTDNKFSFNGRGSHDSYVMFPSQQSAETDSYGLLLHSNGFKFRGSDSASATVNGSGASYVYLAFAAEPIVSSNGDAATAR